MNGIAKLIQYFETYRGHDQSLSVIGYGSLMLSGLFKNNNRVSIKLKTISTQISNARVILRFLDDFSMLGYTLSYGLGKQEKVLLTRILTVISNIASHVYYISEHIAWLADNKIIIKVDSGVYWFISVLCWLISLFSSIVCNLIILRQMLNEKNKKESKDKNADENKKSNLLNKKFVKIYFKLLEDVFFTINAIHWLPAGLLLWSGKLSDFSCGLFGVLSIICNILSKM